MSFPTRPELRRDAFDDPLRLASSQYKKQTDREPGPHKCSGGEIQGIDWGVGRKSGGLQEALEGKWHRGWRASQRARNRQRLGESVGVGKVAKGLGGLDQVLKIE
jgi:hypothetical protein